MLVFWDLMSSITPPDFCIRERLALGTAGPGSLLSFSDSFYQSEGVLFWSEGEFLAWNLICHLAEELEDNCHCLGIPQRCEGTGEELGYQIETFHILDSVLFSVSEKENSL